MLAGRECLHCWEVVPSNCSTALVSQFLVILFKSQQSVRVRYGIHACLPRKSGLYRSADVSPRLSRLGIPLPGTTAWIEGEASARGEHKTPASEHVRTMEALAN